MLDSEIPLPWSLHQCMYITSILGLEIMKGKWIGGFYKALLAGVGERCWAWIWFWWFDDVNFCWYGLWLLILHGNSSGFSRNEILVTVRCIGTIFLFHYSFPKFSDIQRSLILIVTFGASLALLQFKPKYAFFYL